MQLFKKLFTLILFPSFMIYSNLFCEALANESCPQGDLCVRYLLEGMLSTSCSISIQPVITFITFKDGSTRSGISGICLDNKHKEQTRILNKVLEEKYKLEEIKTVELKFQDRPGPKYSFIFKDMNPGVHTILIEEGDGGRRVYTLID